MRNRGDASRPEARGHGNAGSTLPEVLVAMFILTSAVLVMVSGMAVLFASSTQNRQSTTAGVVARDYAEALDIAVAQTGAWCSASYTPVYTPPTGFSVSSVATACPGAALAQFQNVTITATSPNGATELLRMVVRQP